MTNSKDLKLEIINKIDEPISGMQRVTLIGDQFRMVIGNEPELAFTEVKSGKLKLRKFDIGGVPVYSHYKAGKTIFLVPADEVDEHYSPISARLEDLPEVDFDLTDFNLDTHKA